jgi:S1-C subfamily serine protease
MRAVTIAAALGFAIAGGSVKADASVPLPVIVQASGVSSLAPILKQITPAVVSISVREGANAARISPGKGQRAQRAVNAVAADRPFRPSGSGVVIDPDAGIILTNAHVIEGAEEIAVAFADGSESAATRIGSDPGSDIAVIKVPPEALPATQTALTMGNSDALEVGDFVLAIGNPFLIGQTVTSGIVSALHRINVGIGQHEDFIQTDAAIYPGHAGGPLVNLRGEIIGINTAFVGAGNTHSGMGFAIPINMARSIAAQIVKYGDVRSTKGGVVF